MRTAQPDRGGGYVATSRIFAPVADDVRRTARAAESPALIEGENGPDIGGNPKLVHGICHAPGPVSRGVPRRKTAT